MITVREVVEADAEDFLGLCSRLDAETRFMMLEPGERCTTVQEQREIIADIVASRNSTVIVAVADGALSGYVAAYGGEFQRNRHSAYVVTGVLQAFSGRGIGSSLFAALIGWASGAGVHRLELTVMAENQRAIGLYRKFGFEVEGTKRDSLLIGGKYVDELYMARLL